MLTKVKKKKNVQAQRIIVFLTVSVGKDSPNVATVGMQHLLPVSAGGHQCPVLTGRRGGRDLLKNSNEGDGIQEGESQTPHLFQ